MLRTQPSIPSVNLQPVHSLALDSPSLTVTFMRTCRVPRVDGRSSALPAGLGTFPLYKVSDFEGNVPKDWKLEGHFIPVYPQEALWLNFTASKPVALMVGAGMVNAVTGERLGPTLSAKPQNYMVCPTQPWLDGFKPTTGERVFQFVAAQLGSGETAEEQILGSSEFGGIQFGLFHSKIALIPDSLPSADSAFGQSTGFSGSQAKSLRLTSSNIPMRYALSSVASASASLNYAGQDARSMGLGAGGSIRQKIYADPYLLGRDVAEVWHEEPTAKAYIYIVHANDFKSITGHAAPPSPITYKTYQEQKLPWFGMKDGEWGDVEGGAAIDGLTPVSGGPHPTDANALSVDPVTKDLW